jgi:ribosomal protein S18 acetylase RimI-like enzyme
VHHVESQGRAHLFHLQPSSSVSSQSPPRGRILHLDMLAVRPSFAGAGLGTALIRHALAGARQAGFRSACCSVSNVRTMHVRLDSLIQCYRPINSSAAHLFFVCLCSNFCHGLQIVTSKFGFEPLPICVEYADWRVADALDKCATGASAAPESSTPFAIVSQRFPGEAMRFAFLAQL